MKQEQALTIAQELFPELSIGLSREHWVGEYGGTRDCFRVWKTNGSFKILASSPNSWEHAITIARGVADVWEKDTSPVEDEVKQ
jgi:hypothetical protein